MVTVGIDEVGRGSWAGPLVVCAVVTGTADLTGVTDSKLLTRKKRSFLYSRLVDQVSYYGLGWVEASEIDKIGLINSLKKAAFLAIKDIKVNYDNIIIDGTINFLEKTAFENKVIVKKKADLLVPSVSAASIIAKVSRDNYMISIAGRYQQYDFLNNVGYGTKKHQRALELYGLTDVHRRSFRPMCNMK